MPIYVTARFEVQKEALEICKHTIQEFIDYVRANEPDTILYTSLQEKENLTRFLHYFIFRDEKAREIHSNLDAVNRFTSLLYPKQGGTLMFAGIHDNARNMMERGGLVQGIGEENFFWSSDQAIVEAEKRGCKFCS